MTKEEELERLYYDRNMLEVDITLDEDRMREIECYNENYEHDEEWNDLYMAVHNAENEVRDITSCIEEILDTCAE